ncbi:MAG: T9SS type A sorting domain-containing protein [Bacteroidota bacterium]|jgi:hypothetical protein
MKTTCFFLLLSVFINNVQAQCAFGHEGNYSSSNCNPPISPYTSWIVVNDSISFTHYNFWNWPDWVTNDYIQVKMECTYDSVHVTPKWFSMYNGDGIQYSGKGIFNGDTLTINYTMVVYTQSSNSFDTTYPCRRFTLIPVGIEIANNKNYFNIYPNPTNSIININVPSNELIETVHLYNLIGEEILTERIEKKLNLESLPIGLYLIMIVTSNDNHYKSILMKK